MTKKNDYISRLIAEVQTYRRRLAELESDIRYRLSEPPTMEKVVSQRIMHLAYEDNLLHRLMAALQAERERADDAASQLKELADHTDYLRGLLRECESRIKGLEKSPRQATEPRNSKKALSDD